MELKVMITDHLEAGGAHVRETVFLEEQGFAQEYDEIDETALHLQVFDGERVIGAGRIFPEEGTVWHAGRIAVLPEYRGKQVGRLIMQALESRAKALGGTELMLSAQMQAAGFYDKCGYERKSEPYLEEACWHVLMTKKL